MKFECQKSCGGKCCKYMTAGQPMFVFLTKEDMRKLAAYLRQPIERFAKKSKFFMTRFSDGGWYWHLKAPNGATACRFLKDNKCSVYEARPTQCRTFPFWPEIDRPEVYEALRDECPGFDKGEEVHDESIIAEQRDADEKYSI